MKIADKSGMVCADCSYIEHDGCDLVRALEVYDAAPWGEQLKYFDELNNKKGNSTPCWPDLSFRIGKYHISFMKDSEGVNFTVEVCTPRPKKVLGIFNFAKFYEFENVEPSRGKEYLKIFYGLEPTEQYEYFKNQKSIYS